ncbi:hypothetical protein ACN9MJ_12750 [Acidovorax facilis]|uniref:hypothetical protein n=1 Tax=Acidovorax facilis TaxID=12917 RepID=UPI003CF1E997
MQHLTVDHVLNTIRDRHALKSDYAIGKALNISLPVISGWRHGKSLPDERMCQKLAEAAGIDPLVLAASMQAQRSKTTEARSMWEAIAERLQMAAHGAAAAVFAAVVALGLIAGEADAAGTSAVFGLSAQEVNVYTSYLF